MSVDLALLLVLLMTGRGAEGQKIGQYAHQVHTAADVRQPDPAYSVDHWGRVDFPPVPGFAMDTHDPVTQDVYISGSVHGGTKPWDRFIWVARVERMSGVYEVQYVHTLSLSDVLLFIPGHCINAYVVKIDVEGHEAAVIKGAYSWLCTCKVDHVIMEFSEATRTNRDFPAGDMFGLMRKAGYTAQDVAVTGNVAVVLDMDRLAAGEFALAPPNLLFSRRARWGRHVCLDNA